MPNESLWEDVDDGASGRVGVDGNFLLDFAVNLKLLKNIHF